MDGDKELQEAFEFLCNHFFPKWKRPWKIRIVEDLPSGGRANDIKKTIEIRGILADKNSFYELLIYEVCHAVAGPGHGSK